MVKKHFALAYSSLVLLFTFLAGFQSDAASTKLKTRNVILITTDGLRWQDVFTGADADLLNRQNGGVEDTNSIPKCFWRETPEARREALMPFMWNVVAKRGQIFGNQNKGSIVHVTNGKNFSYPGYNEILTGFPNPEINSNDKVPNPNQTVLEWLNNKSKFRGSVAAFSAWDVMPFIINRQRCGFPVMGGWEPSPDKNPNGKEQLLNRLIVEMSRGNNAEVDDPLLFHCAQEYWLRHHPRVMHFSFLETDHWGHAGRYDRLLEAAHRVDSYIQEIWDTVQSTSQYKDKTTLIITTDHGRGFAPKEWKSHGKDINGAENIWMAFLGPDTPSLGERSHVETVTQSQVAATLAAFLGENYRSDVPQAGLPIKEVLRQK